jgi:hypothetical protein
MEPSRADVMAFVARHLRTLDDLEVLMCCIREVDRWWDASTMARELDISVGAARHALVHLARGNLLDIRITGDVRYSFAPGTENLNRTALACADLYRTRPLAILQIITGSTRRQIRDFADAFRIRRDDDS